jgi:hypothetical protein
MVKVSAKTIRNIGDAIAHLTEGIPGGISMLDEADKTLPGEFKDGTDLQTTIKDRGADVKKYLESLKQELLDTKQMLYDTAKKYDDTEHENKGKTKDAAKVAPPEPKKPVEPPEPKEKK